MDQTTWKIEREQDDIRVSSGVPVFAGRSSRVEGFYVTTTLDDGFVSLEQSVSYFRDAVHFALTANAMTSNAQVIWDNGMDRAIVRTGFELPWPLRNREFLHGVAVQRTDDSSALVVYTSLSEEEESALPPPWEGYLRCTMYPSGQRLTKNTGDGILKLEHCMTYPLGGGVAAWVQNRIFHGGHVTAYFDEWKAMKKALVEEAAQ